MRVLLYTKAWFPSWGVQIIGPDKSGNSSMITHTLSLKISPGWHHSPLEAPGIFLLCKLWLKLLPQHILIRHSNCSSKFLNISNSQTTFKYTGSLGIPIMTTGETLMCPATVMETVSGTSLYFPDQRNGGLHTSVLAKYKWLSPTGTTQLSFIII